MGAPLRSLTVRGFKSIRNLEEFPLERLNVLVGANGAGKSNFLELFRILAATTRENGLREYVAGCADSFLFGGPKTTRKVVVQTRFDEDEYGFELAPNSDGFFLIQNEALRRRDGGESDRRVLGGPSFDPNLLREFERSDSTGPDEPLRRVYESISSWKTYHFHDASREAGARRYCDAVRLRVLDSRADMIAAFLYWLKTEARDSYRSIVDCVRLAIPFFQDFVLEPNARGKIRLDWTQKGLAEYPMSPAQFSDGSLRFICLATALLQPNLPTALAIDEPELGLHPEAIALLAELLQSASQKTQIVVATQSPILLDCFEPRDVVVVDRRDGQSIFRRLDPDRLDAWLEDYSLGELWRKNIVDGGIACER